MEHIEEAGIHSGDSSCALPPHSLADEVVAEIERQARLLAERLDVRGLMNVQFAVKAGEVYIIEVNPRASRTMPFVSKATGVSWVNIAVKVMTGASLAELDVTEPLRPKQTSLKAVVFPFAKFPGVDVILGPEMRSTGEVMGIDESFGIAFGKSQMATGLALPVSGTIFVSVCEDDKARIADIVRPLVKIGYELMATSGTYRVLTAGDVPATRLNKLAEGRPNIADLITNGEVDLLINTPTRRGPTTDEGKIRALATLHNIPLITTLTGAEAAVRAMDDLWKGVAPGPVNPVWTVRPLQEHFPHLAR